MSLVVAGLMGCTLSAFNIGRKNDDVDVVELPVTFSGRYRVTRLEILADPDTDGDGTIDNALPESLALLDLAVPESGFSLGPFNERLDEHVNELRPVYIDASIGEGLILDVLSSEIDEDGAVQIRSSTPETLYGTIDSDGEFEAGPGNLTLDVVLREDLASVPLGLLETVTRGSLLDDEMEGTLATLLSIDSIVADVIEPTIPQEGWDVDRDGTPEPRNEVMDIVAGLAELLADTTLQDGSPAISAVLAFEAAASDDE
jgi:hypothetical protein